MSNPLSKQTNITLGLAIIIFIGLGTGAYFIGGWMTRMEIIALSSQQELSQTNAALQTVVEEQHTDDEAEDYHNLMGVMNPTLVIPPSHNH